MNSRVQVASLRDRALEEETDHVVLRLPDQLNDFGRQEIPVLLQEAFRLVNHTSSEMMHREANCVRLWSHVELGLDVVVKFLCNTGSTLFRIVEFYLARRLDRRNKYLKIRTNQRFIGGSGESALFVQQSQEPHRFAE